MFSFRIITVLVGLLAFTIANGQENYDPNDVEKVLEACKTTKRDFFCMGLYIPEDKTATTAEDGFPEGQGCLAEGATPCNTFIVGRRGTTKVSKDFDHHIQWDFYNRKREVPSNSAARTRFFVSHQAFPELDHVKKFVYPPNLVSIEGAFGGGVHYGHNILTGDEDKVATGTSGEDIRKGLYDYKDYVALPVDQTAKWYRHSYTSGDKLFYKYESQATFSVDLTKDLNVLLVVHQVGDSDKKKFFSFQRSAVNLFGRDATTTTTPPTVNPVVESRTFEKLYEKCKDPMPNKFCLGAKLPGGSGDRDGEGCIKDKNCDALVFARRMDKSSETIQYDMVKTSEVQEVVFFVTKTAAGQVLDSKGLPPNMVGVQMVGSPNVIASSTTDAATPDTYQIVTPSQADPNAITFKSKEDLAFTNGYAVNLVTDELYPVLSMSSVANPSYVESRPSESKSKLIEPKATTSTPATTTTRAPSQGTDGPKTGDESTTKGTGSGGKSGTGMTVAIIIGVIALLAIVGGGIWYFLIRKPKPMAKNQPEATPEAEPAVDVPGKPEMAATPAEVIDIPLEDKELRSDMMKDSDIP